MGEFISAFVATPNGTISGLTNSLGLTTCFDFPATANGSSASSICFGDATLAPGATFTARANISGPATLSVLGLTVVVDPVSGDELGSATVFSDVITPTCTPIANVSPVTLTGVPYTVSWTDVTDLNPTFVVQESTFSDFRSISGTQTVSPPARSAQFQHGVTTTTTYYYRVHALSCGGAVGPLSKPVSIVVQLTPPSTSRGTDVVVPFGSTGQVDVPVTVTVTATSGTFTASVDKPYLTVSPSSGNVPSDGKIHVVVKALVTGLPPGANTGTVTVTTFVTQSSGAGQVRPLDGVVTAVPVSISTVTPVGPGGKTLPPANALIIPIVTHVNGFSGPFQSDVRVTNSSLGAMKYQVSYTPTRTDGTTSTKTTSITVDAGQTIALNDIVKDFFGVGATGDPSDAGAGSLEIRPLNSSSTQTNASSRTFVTTAKGTLGQFIAAVPFPLFASKAVAIVPIGGGPAVPPILSLQQVAQSAKFRTNLGIVEGMGQPANGHITIYDDRGTALKTVDFKLQAGEHQQMNQFIAANGIATLDDGRIEITVDSDTGAVSAYASVLDQITTDPLAVMPARPSLIQSTRYVLPGMSELISQFTNFHSDIRLYNGGTTSATTNLTFYPQGGGTPVPAPQPITIAAGEVKAIDNVLQSLFNLSGTGGSIIATTSTTSSLVTTGRTYTNSLDPDQPGGTYGQFIPGVIPAEGIGTGDRPLQVMQLEQSQNFRSNLGLAELTGNTPTVMQCGGALQNPVTVCVHVIAYVPDSKTTGAADVPLGPNQFIQLGSVLAGMYPGQSVYNARISVGVTSGTGRVTSYGSVIDAATADPTYFPAQ